MVITGNPNFVKKVVFPLEVLPVAKIGDAAFHLSVGLILVLAGSAFGTTGLNWHVLFLPMLVLPLLLLALGLAWTLSAFGVFFRDITQVMPFITTAILFASAIFYPPAKIQAHPAAWEFLRFNPILQIVDLARHVVLWHEPMAWTRLGYVYALAITALLAGNLCFGVLRRSFAEVI
jgi:lipopolysaccharide transport system permease protein